MAVSGPADEFESIQDRQFSPIAFIGLLLSLIGIASLFLIQAIPFSLIGSGLGAFALFRKEKWSLGPNSVRFGFLAVVLGLFFGSWGFVYRYLTNDRMLSKAREVAEEYIQLLANGEAEAAFRLSRSREEALGNRSDEAAVVGILASSRSNLGSFTKAPGIYDILKKGKEGKWEFVGTKVSDIADGKYYAVLLFRDRSVTNSRLLNVRVIREKIAERDNEYSWFVPDCDWERK